MLEVLSRHHCSEGHRHRAITRRSPNCFFAVISQPLIYDGDMKCSCLMTHVGHCVCKSGGWLSGKVQVVPASPQCRYGEHGLSVNSTLGLSHEWALPASFIRGTAGHRGTVPS